MRYAATLVLAGALLAGCAAPKAMQTRAGGPPASTLGQDGVGVDKPLPTVEVPTVASPPTAYPTMVVTPGTVVIPANRDGDPRAGTIVFDNAPGVMMPTAEAVTPGPTSADPAQYMELGATAATSP